MWWDPGRSMPPRPRSIVELIEARVLDPELAALLWLLVEARLPVVVVGAQDAGRTTLLTALLDFLPADARPVPLAGAEEDFDWLPEAPELGWRRERGTADAGTQPPTPGRSERAERVPPPRPTSTILLIAELGDRPPVGTWGARARIAIRALALGYGMAATMTGERLEDVFDRLRAAPVSASDDELSRLGVVLVVRASASAEGQDPRRRLVAAHYVRPVVRDAQGHVQRLTPAVLAALDERSDRLEHYSWGIVGELAGRTGLRPIAFEREQARRASYLGDLLAARITDPGEVRRAIAGYHRAGDGRPA